MNRLKFTGERLLPNVDVLTYGDLEHINRYAFVNEFVIGKNVMDIASGEGYGSMLLSETAKKVTGVDISKEVIKEAKLKYVKSNLHFLEGSTDMIPIQDNEIDIAVSFETIEHHDKHDLMLQEIKRVLTNDGALIISTPIKSNYAKREPDNEFHVKELEYDEFEQLLQKYFKNVKMFKQKIIMGALIEAVENKNISYFEYAGNFQKLENKLTDKRNYNTNYFTLAVCSDVNIDHYNSNCFFDGSNMILQKDQKYLEVINSIEYRILKKMHKIFNTLSFKKVK